jgi:hypothetical protein
VGATHVKVISYPETVTVGAGGFPGAAFDLNPVVFSSEKAPQSTIFLALIEA